MGSERLHSHLGCCCQGINRSQLTRTRLVILVSESVGSWGSSWALVVGLRLRRLSAILIVCRGLQEMGAAQHLWAGAHGEVPPNIEETIATGSYLPKIA